MKPTTVLTSSGSKALRDSVGPRFERELVDAVDALSAERRAALAGLEVHHIPADPRHVARGVMFEHCAGGLPRERKG